MSYLYNVEIEKRLEKLCGQQPDPFNLYRDSDDCKFEELLGKTLTEVIGAEVGSHSILFICDDGSIYLMTHYQECCEIVDINDINGSIDKLIGNPILKAEKSTNSDEPALDEYDDSHTWTFYHLATIRGYVDIRWYGSSNGYYSESVDFIKVK